MTLVFAGQCVAATGAFAAAGPGRSLVPSRIATQARRLRTRVSDAVRSRVDPWSTSTARARRQRELRPLTPILEALHEGPASWKWRQRAADLPGSVPHAELARAEIPRKGTLRLVLQLTKMGSSGDTYYPPEARLAAVWVAAGAPRAEDQDILFFPPGVDSALVFERLFRSLRLSDADVPLGRLVGDSLVSLLTLEHSPEKVTLLPEALQFPAPFHVR